MRSSPPFFATLTRGAFFGAVRGVCATWNWLLSLARNLKGQGAVEVTGVENGSPMVSLNIVSGDDCVIVTLEPDGAYRISYQPQGDDEDDDEEDDDEPGGGEDEPGGGDDDPSGGGDGSGGDGGESSGGGTGESCNEWSQHDNLAPNGKENGWIDNGRQSEWARQKANEQLYAKEVKSQVPFYRDARDRWGSAQTVANENEIEKGLMGDGSLDNKWSQDDCRTLNGWE